MAELTAVDKSKDRILVTLQVTRQEYDLLRDSEDEMLILPAGGEVFADELTTGTLGNGNRVMLPNRMLERNKVTTLNKKLKSRIFDVEGRKYLLIKLEEAGRGVPVFRE